MRLGIFLTGYQAFHFAALRLCVRYIHISRKAAKKRRRRIVGDYNRYRKFVLLCTLNQYFEPPNLLPVMNNVLYCFPEFIR